jgi:hypothetical protein
MITFLLVALLGTLLAVVLIRLSKSRPVPPPPAPPPADLANLTLADARAGDILLIPGAGDDLGDLSYTIDRITRYTAGAHRWYELGGLYHERRVAVRVPSGDETDAAVSSSAVHPTLEDLGLSEEDLAQMDQRQNPSDTFGYDGVAWYYRRSHEAHLSRDGQAGTTAFYYWEFEEPPGRRLLAVRKEEGEPFAASVYQKVHAGDITVLRDA